MILEQVDLLLPIKDTPCDAMHKAGFLINPILFYVSPFYSRLKYTVVIIISNTFIPSSPLSFINHFNIASCKKSGKEGIPFVSAILKFLKFLSLPHLCAQTKVTKENPVNYPAHRNGKKKMAPPVAYFDDICLWKHMS